MTYMFVQFINLKGDRLFLNIHLFLAFTYIYRERPSLKLESRTNKWIKFTIYNNIASLIFCDFL